MSDESTVILSFTTEGANLDAIDASVDRIAREFFGDAEWVTIELHASRHAIRTGDDTTASFSAAVIVAAL